MNSAKDRLYDLLTRITDWDSVAVFAGKHGVWPLLVRTLTSSMHGDVSQLTLSGIQQRVSDNEYKLAAICEITSLLAAADIRSIFYKGPVLGITVYHDQTLRICRDIDLLVHPRDYTKSATFLGKHGYTLYMRCGNKNHFLDPTKHLDVDVHRALVPRWYGFALDFDDVWQRSSLLMPASDGKARGFALEDLLIVLCLDLVKDIAELFSVRLIKVTDIVALLTREETLLSPALIRRIRTLGVYRVTLFGLFMAVRLYNVPLPPEVRSELEPQRGLVSLANLAIRLILNDNWSAVRGRRRFHEIRTIITLHDSVQAKIRAICFFGARALKLKCTSLLLHIITKHEERRSIP